MVNQLTIAVERKKLILSPFDEVLHKQLVDYSVERISQSGVPVYTSKNEHFVDALGLAYLAFVLEFPNLTQSVKQIENTSKMVYVHSGFQAKRAQIEMAEMSMSKSSIKNPWANVQDDPRELRGDKQKWYKVPVGTPLGYYKDSSRKSGGSVGWGSRSGRTVSGNTRSSF